MGMHFPRPCNAITLVIPRGSGAWQNPSRRGGQGRVWRVPQALASVTLTLRHKDVACRSEQHVAMNLKFLRRRGGAISAKMTKVQDR